MHVSAPYYRARYYDLQIGRFLSEDALRFNTGANFYSYVKNSPVSLRDPTGHLAWGGGINFSGMFGLFNGGYGGEAGCYAVGDLKGNSGLLCCAAGGGGLVRGGGVSAQPTSVVCPNCDTICDMEGGFAQVHGFGGAGGGWGGGGGASIGMRTATVFAGAGPGLGGGGGVVVLGGGCKSKWGGSNCKKCAASK